MQVLIKTFLNIEPTVIGYERTVYITPEGNRTVELCARVFSPAGGSPRDIVISATMRDGTAGTTHQSLICLYTALRPAPIHPPTQRLAVIMLRLMKNF